ncbi:2OG-Fe(II) oxygenase [Haloechinothrix halophila]|uniref:2OG-Fe(II) oxygenase n=1 Tax=Haloechinothrix halophila TaxID=1069073 RepID=UPI0003FB3B47|nr:2OG-Fe(II) oxygenase [Haloechinothrix halophila]
MKALHQVADFLGAKRRGDVLQLLGSPDLAWQRSDALGRTTSGRMWQLAKSDMHRQPAMRQLSVLVASVVYDEVTAALPATLPPPEDLVPQVFPVRMDGNPDEPPTQMPHRDGEGGPSPIVTTLYYAQVENAVGGALVLHDDSGTVRARIQPASDKLVVIGGRQVHSVEPLTAGRRTTIVTNFYRAG